MKLADKTALVTGGGSGIGRATAELFAQEGARVAVLDRDGEAAESVAKAISGRSYRLDVGERTEVEDTFARVADDLGPAQILVTAAGFSGGHRLVDTSEELWDEIFRVNVKGTYLCLKAVIPGMAAAGGGSVITVGSQLAHAGGRDNAAYIASKGAVISLTRSAALEHAADNIRVNVMIPGAIATPMLERGLNRHADPEAARARSQGRHAMGRFGTPQEIAKGALYLASDDSTFVTGSELVMDGGWLAA
jgi:NAD(P)-dependent dehydrogenase (short-subunit alcohol dehydrogenase family)